ncbi:type I restriction endonuclease subunit R [Methanoplanus sp. FWC-SCC4]|uniref:type I site-specific deoxyribonuclease n=1 Tax=Methanochimaera problematica TaxID=2609417 RepID=A0AA97F9P8_9EURY|nr:type I restriction endonuclease subunit R [Methanoplanus sp. FWC-SCC4]WOF15410.1 type I restriction endonuclease subunit R [Methanoplanus sp. FWC-SCC4]
MSANSAYSEDTLVEQPAIRLFEELGWQTQNCFDETFKTGGGSCGRETTSEVILIKRLIPALERLNPTLPAEALDIAVEELVRDRSKMSPVAANREVYELLKNGVRVRFRNDAGGYETENVKVIDWRNPDNNDFFLASQLWITGELYKRRTDLLGFVNGIPLVFIELKASHRNLKSAFDDNLTDYKTAIPQLFWYNALLILSNGSESRIGSITSSWEYFSDWKRINSEGEAGVISLDTIIRGTCERDRLLDIIENFTLFTDIRGGIIKIVAKNHQYLGVNNAIKSLRQARENKGRLGVFWHTQGSGKSISMIFFTQKILRTVPGNWTFLVVTDRQELDDQIYKNFVNSGAITEKEAQASSGENLRQLLSEDHRYVFTLIQKFRTEKGAVYQKISDRDDIIVITDEAHRSQYDTFAINMRNAIPNAAFIGFTGTPLLVGEEKTKEVFGDYVSIYDFKQSIEDGATVPLYYENRRPELQLINPDLNEQMAAIIDETNLDEESEKKLEREFAREYHLITRDDRLEKVAEDLVDHFMGRGIRGKAMVISIDKATAVIMHEKVRKYWDLYLRKLKVKSKTARGEELNGLKETIAYMEGIDMAVVVSQSQNEIPDMQKKGIDIIPHRKRMVNEDLDKKFKDPKDPFSIVFVCAMWMTGFDVPSCSTIYLDKPMRNHTLMQTIARANRVFPDKENGLIVDYIGIFRNLQKALAIYAPGRDDGKKLPIGDKTILVEKLREAISKTRVFCEKLGIDVDSAIKNNEFKLIKTLDESADKILVNDESKSQYLAHAAIVSRLFKAIKPDPAVVELQPACTFFLILAEKINSYKPVADISKVMDKVEKLLDKSTAAKGYEIKEGKPVYIAQLNVDDLRKRFKMTQQKRTEAEILKNILELKTRKMIRVNRTRMDFLRKLNEMIDAYNNGSKNVEEFFEDLCSFTDELNEEDQRSIKENLTEEELIIFDLLIKPEMKLSKKEEAEVKKVAKDLLMTMKQNKLVLDWRKRQQSRAEVRVCIDEILDQLPRAYTPEIYQEKCDIIYQHVFDSYSGEGAGVYESY